MKFCKYCGVEIDNDISVCPSCHRALTASPVSTSVKTESTFINKSAAIRTIAAVIVIAIIVLCISVANHSACRNGSCSNKAVPGYDYCYSHKCSVPDCPSSCYTYSNYCYTHYLTYDDDAIANYVASYELKFSDIRLYSEYNYTYAEGTLTNTSDATVTFVKIKGAFKTSQGKVIDTDWTYAVGSEGLAPGESCKWELSVSKDTSIKNCDVSILDYDY